MIANIPLFSGLNESELAQVSQHAVTRTYPKSTVIINEGDTAESLYVILKGKVKVFLTDETGKEVVINSQGPGEYFGEVALIDDAQRSASVMTLEPSSFSVISKHSFRELLSKNPNIALSVIRDLTQRVRVLTENVKSLALLDVYGRVAKTLLSMASEQDGRLLIEEKLTQQDIANRVGASREMVSRILKDLTAGGYIQMEDKHIVINERLPKHY
ncbi:MAG: Crp/Fnr family transcriptional regulator [Pseudomonadota bacterium]